MEWDLHSGQWARCGQPAPCLPAPLAVRGRSFQPFLGHHMNTRHPHLEAECMRVALPVYLFLQILPN